MKGKVALEITTLTAVRGVQLGPRPLRCRGQQRDPVTVQMHRHVRVADPAELDDHLVPHGHRVHQNSVRVYSFAKPPDLLHVYETADNFLGLCCLSEKKLAFPGRTAGQIQLA